MNNNVMDKDKEYFKTLNVLCKESQNQKDIINNQHFSIAKEMLKEIEINDIYDAFLAFASLNLLSHLEYKDKKEMGYGTYFNKFLNKINIKNIYIHADLSYLYVTFYDFIFSFGIQNVGKSNVPIKYYLSKPIRFDNIKKKPMALTLLMEAIGENKNKIYQKYLVKLEEANQLKEESKVIEPQDNDIDIDYIESLPKLFNKPCRKVYCGREFLKDYMSCEGEIREKVTAIKNNLCLLPLDKLEAFLNSKNCKKLQGCEGMFKFRLTPAARITFLYLDNGSMCLDRIILQHDDQGRLAKDRLGKEQDIYEFMFDRGSSLDLHKDKIRYDAVTFLPILTYGQERYVSTPLPAIINGSAGSGKTCIAIEMYHNYYEMYPNKRIIYITKSRPLVEHVYEELQLSGVAHPLCSTYQDICLKDKHIKMISYKETYQFFKHEQYYHKSYKDMTFDTFKLCLDSLIKGDSSLIDSPNKILDYANFKILAQREGITSQLDNIYNLALKYQEYLESQALYDDNDIASFLSSHKSYDAIIIDESQDLSKKEIQALIRLVNSQDIVLLGDKNQVVESSTFDFGQFKKDMLNNQEINNCPIYTLKNTYRCGPRLVEYINYLNDVRRNYVAYQTQEDDAKEVSMLEGKDDDRYAFLVTEDNSINYTLRNVLNASNCHILVDNSDDKEALLDLLGTTLAPNIVTISEAKGLDYPIVVIYKFIEHNERYFKELLEGKGKRSTLHRIIFNKYYVACSRAEDRIIILEDKKYVDQYKELLFKDILECNDQSVILSFLDTNIDSWLISAKAYYNSKSYDEALAYLDKYKSYSKSVIDDDFNKLYEQTTMHVLANNTQDLGELLKIAEFFESIEPYYALKLYQDMGDNYHEFMLSLKLDIKDNITLDKFKVLIKTYKIKPEDEELIMNHHYIQAWIKEINNNLK